MASELTIGRVAKLAGVSVETIRYYQRRGLLTEPDKPHMGYRRYPADIVKHIRFIKRAQALGFSLQEIIELLRKIRLDVLYSIYVVFAVAVIVRYAWSIAGLLRGEAPEEIDITKTSSGL